VLRHVERQFHARGGHLRATRAEELRVRQLAAQADTSSAASKSPLASPAMSMKVFGFNQIVTFENLI